MDGRREINLRPESTIPFLETCEAVASMWGCRGDEVRLEARKVHAPHSCDKCGATAEQKNFFKFQCMKDLKTKRCCRDCIGPADSSDVDYVIASSSRPSEGRSSGRNVGSDIDSVVATSSQPSEGRGVGSVESPQQVRFSKCLAFILRYAPAGEIIKDHNGWVEVQDLYSVSQARKKLPKHWNKDTFDRALSFVVQKSVHPRNGKRFERDGSKVRALHTRAEVSPSIRIKRSRTPPVEAPSVLGAEAPGIIEVAFADPPQMQRKFCLSKVPHDQGPQRCGLAAHSGLADQGFGHLAGAQPMAPTKIAAADLRQVVRGYLGREQTPHCDAEEGGYLSVKPGDLVKLLGSPTLGHLGNSHSSYVFALRIGSNEHGWVPDDVLSQLE